MLRSLLVLVVSVLAIACARPAVADPVERIPLPTDAERIAYWNQGKGEVTSYALKQARYGELHEGHAVLVYVTEPFSRSKHVKLDAPSQAVEDRIDVLKLNLTRKFATGVYPYSTMHSVYTPVDGGRARKVSASVQEWCGQVFMQLTQRENGAYGGHLFSYFEAEGDQAIELSTGAWLEDDLWNTIRIDPNRLPTGPAPFPIVPGATYLRLLHVPVEIQAARGRLLRVDDATLAYELQYTTVDRVLRIEFEHRFPFRILRWTETQPSGWGNSRKRLTTTAERQASLMTDYWTKHQNPDRALREKLGLP